MLIQFLILAGGLFLLVIGAQRLILGASSLALRLGMTPLVVGLTVVAFGTSAPELAVSVKATLGGDASLALANVIGSNIFNVLFILGLCAMVAPLVVARSLIWRDVPVMVGCSLLLLFFAWDGLVQKWEAAILCVIFVAYTIHILVDARKEKNQNFEDESAVVPEENAVFPIWISALWVIIGLALLVLGSQWMVDAAIAIATQLGVDQVIIGLTIVAAGTSLPEVAASLIATLKGERDLAVGNVVGSNIFNILMVGGLSGLVSAEGLPVVPGLIFFDLPVACATAIACLPIFFSGHQISRWEGILFFCYYIFYTTYLVLTATQHSALAHMETAMIGFVIPLTVVTLILITWRSWRVGRAKAGKAG